MERRKEGLSTICFSEDWEVNHIGGTPPPHFNYLEMGFLAFYALELGLRLLTCKIRIKRSLSPSATA